MPLWKLINYFTKEAFATITKAKVTTFIWTNIVSCFGTLNAIVTENGKQFINAKFKDLCTKHEIRYLSLSPSHPKTNEQVEAINKIMKRGFKLRLDSRKRRWAEKPLEVL